MTVPQHPGCGTPQSAYIRKGATGRWTKIGHVCATCWRFWPDGKPTEPAAKQLVAKTLAFATGDDRCPSCRRLGIELCRHKQ